MGTNLLGLRHLLPLALIALRDANVSYGTGPGVRSNISSVYSGPLGIRVG